MLSLKSSTLFAIQVLLVIAFPFCVKADIFDQDFHVNVKSNCHPSDTAPAANIMIATNGDPPTVANGTQQFKGPVVYGSIYDEAAQNNTGIPVFNFWLQQGNSSVEMTVSGGGTTLSEVFTYWYISTTSGIDVGGNPVPFGKCPNITQCSIGNISSGCTGPNPNTCNVDYNRFFGPKLVGINIVLCTSPN